LWILVVKDTEERILATLGQGGDLVSWEDEKDEDGEERTGDFPYEL
jgi:hypothetical protein